MIRRNDDLSTSWYITSTFISIAYFFVDNNNAVFHHEHSLYRIKLNYKLDVVTNNSFSSFLYTNKVLPLLHFCVSNTNTTLTLTMTKLNNKPYENKDSLTADAGFKMSSAALRQIITHECQFIKGGNNTTCV